MKPTRAELRFHRRFLRQMLTRDEWERARGSGVRIFDDLDSRDRARHELALIRHALATVPTRPPRRGSSSLV